MNAISIVLVIIVAFLAGMEGILDEFQFHQPLVACTLIGIVCGQPAAGIILGGSLQMIAMGWANIGAAVAPDAALASVASAIILMKSGQGADGASTAIAVAIPLAVAGLFLTMIARTLAVPIVHGMDKAAENASYCHPCRSSLRRSRRGCCKSSEQHACMADRRYVHRRRHGRCSRLCARYQHDGDCRSVAFLLHRLRACCYFRPDTDRPWYHRSCDRFHLSEPV